VGSGFWHLYVDFGIGRRKYRAATLLARQKFIDMVDVDINVQPNSAAAARLLESAT
jgi:hypothetical protein